MKPKLPILLTVQRFSEDYGVSERTVREWCRNGTLVAWKKGNTWFVDMERSFPDERNQEAAQAL